MSNSPVKKSDVKKPAKKAADHPKYIDMIAAAIAALKERKGSSRQAITKYLQSNYKLVNPDSCKSYVNQALKKGVQTGALKQVKGTGASGSFKLAEKPKAVKKVTTKKKSTPAKKSAVKSKTPTKKVAKKPAAKKSAKKPAAAAAKITTAKKAPAAKKPAAKKPAAKKPVAKKPTAKKAVKKTPKKKTAAKK